MSKSAAPKRKAATRKAVAKLSGNRKAPKAKQRGEPTPEMQSGATAAVLDRLFETVMGRRDADPNLSHSARLLSAVAGNSEKLIGESADMLYHLIVMWVDAGLHPDAIWAELRRREGTSGIAEKASRAIRRLPASE